MSDHAPDQEVILQGVAASPGIAYGPVFVFLHKEPEIPIYGISDDERVDEITRFEQALLETRAQINKLRAEVAKKLSEDEAKIFDAHLLVLEDKALIEETIQEFKQSGLNIEHCFYEVSKRYLDAFANMDDEYLKERVADIRDVTKRVLLNLIGSHGPLVNRLPDQRVVVSEDLTPSDTASLDRSRVLAIATDSGGRTSHGVIMARSLQVPAVVALKEISLHTTLGDSVLVDGYEGVVIVNPKEETLKRYQQIKQEKELIQNIFNASKDLPYTTKDGKQISLSVNIEDINEVASLIAHNAPSIGLYRTENIFLSQLHFPTEEEQFNSYKQLVERIEGRPITIRTIDLGGDKKVFYPHMPKEANPFMGFRAIRFCLEHEDVFKEQLRAILRVSALGNVKLMYPMISSLNELIQANKILDDCKQELEGEGIPYDNNMPVGIMVEVPSAATIVDLLADHCDFFSIGTNDLIQYMLAVDRVNQSISHLYEPHHPSVLRTIKSIIENAHKKNLTVSICGEMAGDPLYVPLLYGLGADDLSISLSSFAEIKYLINNCELKEVRELVEKVMKEHSSNSILTLLRNFYIDHIKLP